MVQGTKKAFQVKRFGIYRILSLDFYRIIKIRINENATAVFTNNDFFVLADFALTLRRDGVEATTAAIPVNGNYSQTVTVTFADAFKAAE